MSVVVDTHALVIALTKPSKLGKDARRVFAGIEAGRVQGYLPAAAAVEMMMLRDIKRTDIGMADVLSTLRDMPSLRFLDLDKAQLEVFATLSSIRDPFDRLVVSATLATKSTLVSKDAAIAESGLVEVVW